MTLLTIFTIRKSCSQTHRSDAAPERRASRRSDSEATRETMERQQERIERPEHDPITRNQIMFQIL